MAGMATKHVHLYCLPEILVMHLKRFQYTGSTVKNHKASGGQQQRGPFCPPTLPDWALHTHARS